MTLCDVFFTIKVVTMYQQVWNAAYEMHLSLCWSCSLCSDSCAIRFVASILKARRIILLPAVLPNSLDTTLINPDT